MKKTSSFLIFILSVANLIAQTKQLRIEDTANPAFRPKPLTQLQWIPNTEFFTYIDNNTVIKSDVTNTKSPLLTLDELNAALKNTENPSALKGFPQMEWQDEKSFTFINHPSLMRYNTATKQAEILNWWNENADHYDISKNQNVAYVTKGTLWVSAKGDKKPREVAKGDGHNIVCGMSVHREEFGISKGTFWSPNGEKLAFYRMDQSMVTDYPMANYRPSTCATPKLIKYPMAGAKSHHVTVGVYDVKKKKVKYLATGEPAEQYLTNVTWNPEGTLIYIQVLNRDQNNMKLNVYDAKSGAFSRTILEESHLKYVEPLHELTFLPNNPNQFIYQSQKDGFNHLYLYKTDGTFVKQITQGSWLVQDIIGFSKDAKTIYINATKESPLETNAYAVNMDNQSITRLTPDAGMHNVIISNTDNYILDSYSNATTFYKVNVNNLQGKRCKIY